MQPPSAELLDRLERAILAFERDGEDGLQAELRAAGPLAAEVQRQIDALRTADLLRPPELPTRIGNWRVLQRLGTGGMGSVFLGDQQEPIARRGAIKVIRAGMDSHEVLARFALERQALALLNHPGVARILDAGSSAEGRPFLVMEYVPGQPICRYADERQLDPRARLELFAKVCDAVQHAHHKGLLHRDLKPSNILVTDRDGAPFPVVIDFGVAKSLGAIGRAAMTLPGRLLGTPEYMSPEQAANQDDVDTRSDVYSLGVVLYELLTSTLPIDGKELRGGDLGRVLATREPATPSTRITQLGDEGQAVAARRQVSVGALRRTLRGELDWIVMKALERDRNRRYGMPGELAADVRRHLAHEPVSAGAPGPWYRLRKYCARHRLEAAAGAIVLGALTAGLGTSIAFWRDAQASAAAAQTNATQARENAADATAALDAALLALGELVQVGDSDLVKVPHLEDVRRDLLQRSVAAYRGFLARGTIDDPRLLERTLDALLRLGNMLGQLGDEDGAWRHLQEAQQLLASPAAVAALPATTRQRAQCDVLLDLARIHDKRYRFPEALALVLEALPLARAIHAAAPDDPREARGLTRALVFEANQRRDADPARAMALLDEALPLVEAAQRAQPDDPAAVAQVLAVGVKRADLLRVLGRPQECLAAVAPLRELRSRHAQPNAWPLIQATLPLLDLLHAAERPDEVRQLADELQPELERLQTNHPTIVAYRTALISLWNARANAQLMQQGFGAALASQGTVQRLCEEGLQLAPGNAPIRRHLIISCLNVSLIQQEQLRQRGSWDEAAVEHTLRRALELLDSMPGSEPQRQSRADRCELLSQRARFRELRKDPAGARADYVAAIAIAEELVAESPDAVTQKMRLVDLRRRHGALLLAAGEAAAALPQLEATLAVHDELAEHAVHKRRYGDRRRDLLLLLARARGEVGDLERAFAALDAHLELGLPNDWIGRNNAILALTQLLARLPADDARAPRVLARGRELVAAALGFEEPFAARGTGHGTLAVMRGNTQALARDLEEAGRDVAAATRLAAACVASFAEARDDGASSRAEQRLLDAIDAQAALLRRVGDPATRAAAHAHARELFDGAAEPLARVDAAFASPPPRDVAK